MDTLHLLLNVVTITFIMATMFAAGLGTTLRALGTTLSNIRLLLLALLANLVVIPLLGWGVAALFGLQTAAYIAFVLVASSPGGPFGAKLAMIQKGDVVAGAATQVLLAAIGSITFGITANWILTAANVGGGISLNVGTLVRTVAILQLIPFIVGLLMRHWVPQTALAWHPAASKVSNLTFLLVLAGMLLGNWQDVVALFGSRTLLAGAIFTAAAFAAGTLLATGPTTRRTTAGGVASVRNAGPVLAAIGIAFDNEPAILGALAAILLTGLAVVLAVASALGSRRTSAAATAPMTPEKV